MVSRVVRAGNDGSQACIAALWGLTIDCSNQQLSGFALMTDASRLRDPQAASDLLM